jgi:hypothetical protein
MKYILPSCATQDRYEFNTIGLYEKVILTDSFGSAIKIMEFMAMFDELLLPVLTRIQGRPEIPDLRSLEGGAERAECRLDIVCLISYRAVINTVNTFHLIATRKRCTNRMSRFAEDKHAETGEKEF